MSTTDIQTRRQDLVNKAITAERKIGRSTSRNAQLENTIAAAELYMQALRLVDNPVEKKQIDQKTRELISIAESLKKINDGGMMNVRRTNSEHPISRRTLTKREEIILLEGSKLNGTLFRPWSTIPQPEEFLFIDGAKPFTDNVELSLSEAQKKHFAGWERANEAVALIKREKDGQLLPNKGTMNKLGIWDLVQDVAPDCSVVASLCVGTARAEKGHKRILSSIVYPYDREHEHPVLSPNGRYVMRLNFNGCWRKVEIDDRLPTSKSSRALFVIDRSHPGLVWPALVEKAYLKVRGGYDFPGSNSGTDLAVLTGWIPQQIFLHDEDVDPEHLWQELFPAFIHGEILLTLGTGKLGQREQRQLGLGAEHDYAVLDMKETDSVCELLIKNPWADGDVWKSATRCRPNPGHESPENGDTAAEQMMPGTFWMDFNSVFQYFEHVYINWDPSLFRYREDIHFTHNLISMTTTGYLLVDQPQFAIHTEQSEEVRILLNRHFRTGDFTSQNHGKNGYISLYLFNKKEIRVFSSEDARSRGPFVDSPNTLLRFQSTPDESYTVVVMTQDLPIGKHNFTLSSFSSGPVELSPASERYEEPRTLTLAWTRSTAGGSSDSPKYLQNPQLSLRADSDMQITLVLKVVGGSANQELTSDIHVKLLIASSDGNRIVKLRPRDITAQSGDYRKGCAVLETTLTRGNYTIICSTFQQGQLAQFSIDCYSTAKSQCTLHALPAEGSGRFSITMQPARFMEETTKLIARVKVYRVTKTLFRCSQVQNAGSTGFRISLEQGQGPYRRCLATSASDDAGYTNIPSDLRIGDLNLDAALASEQVGGLWAVVERPAVSSIQQAESPMLYLEALSEERIEVGGWNAVDE